MTGACIWIEASQVKAVGGSWSQSQIWLHAILESGTDGAHALPRPTGF